MTGCATPTRGAGELLEPATQRVTEAEQLLTQIATAVSPGAKLSKYDDQGRYSAEPDVWTACTAPLKGQVYKGIVRFFEAPAGRTGADLAPALMRQFEAHGFHISHNGAINDVGDHVDFRGQTQSTDFSLLAYKNSRQIQINFGTQCGSPPPGPITIDTPH
ncbi:MAG: hypothetical protein FWD74_07765 [Actinomycetia bacterium]|nr:hypothetical protein [Actinomycetes bacterium]